ncbi:hypothetical protein Q31b_44420 [Novipirellula aureliae]|uniref:Uncharacterized protein n=1 Tax=Novipirellula aureliae TaxID=2527966 RepID=A0A5C6DNA4_9BACT|nr:hypothetical protein Q31b_44420 [Novipirellula aureliae]
MTRVFFLGSSVFPKLLKLLVRAESCSPNSHAEFHCNWCFDREDRSLRYRLDWLFVNGPMSHSETKDRHTSYHRRSLLANCSKNALTNDFNIFRLLA